MSVNRNNNETGNDSGHLHVEISDQVATVTLNRPEINNAFNAELITQLTQVFQTLDTQAEVRVIVLTAAGKVFSAGADLSWMRSMADAAEAENRDDALRLAAMFRAINDVSKPVVARVNGHAFGGGVGMLACADVVVADEAAKFGLTEVRLGLIPATIAPFVQAKIGASQMRRYAVSGGHFNALTAQRIGLVHELASTASLEAQVQQQIEVLLQAGPVASAECKQLVARINQVQTQTAAAVDAETAAWIARLRVSAEGQEGLQAFLSKRHPSWRS